MEPRRVVPAACAPSDSGGVTLAAAMYTTTSHCRRLMIEVFVPDRVSVFRQAAANYLSVTYASLHHTSSSYYADERQKEEKRKYCIEAMSLIEMKVVHVTGKLQIIVLFWKGYSLSLRQFLVVLLHQGCVDLNLSRRKCRGSDKLESWVANQFASKPQERLFEIVIGLGRDFKVLDAFLPVESHGSSLDLPLLNINLVSAQHNGDVLAYTLEIAVPIGDVLVCDARRDVKHDNATLALDVITITETTKFFLSGSIPNIEDDIAVVGGEGQGVDFNTKGGDVFFLKFTSQVTLDKSSFSRSSITNYAS
jgi:hypothetical protein